MRNSNTKRYKSGNPALLSAHFADSISAKNLAKDREPLHEEPGRRSGS
jgi:hypothetical protein